MNHPAHPLAEPYTLTCQHCQAVRRIYEVGSAGLVLGTVLSHSPSDPDYGRCNRCRRYKMMVTAAPPRPEPPKPQGFTKVPTR